MICACDVCEMVEFCQFLCDNEIQDKFPDLKPFCACDEQYSSPEGYREGLEKEIARLKEKKNGETSSHMG